MFTYADSISSASTTFLERPDVVNVATVSYGGLDPRRGIELTFQQADLIRPGDNLVVSGAFTGQQPGGNPATPTMDDMTVSHSGAVAMWIRASGPLSRSGILDLDRIPDSERRAARTGRSECS